MWACKSPAATVFDDLKNRQKRLGLERFHFEVKRVERLNVPAAMQQAERDADGRIPAVVHRRNRAPWLITMHLEDWIKGQSP